MVSLSTFLLHALFLFGFFEKIKSQPRPNQSPIQTQPRHLSSSKHSTPSSSAYSSPMEITRKALIKASATFFDIVFALVVEVLAFVVFVLLFPHHHHPRPPRPRPRLLRRPQSRQVSPCSLPSLSETISAFRRRLSTFSGFLRATSSRRRVNVFVDALLEATSLKKASTDIFEKARQRFGSNIFEKACQRFR